MNQGELSRLASEVCEAQDRVRAARLGGSTESDVRQLVVGVRRRVDARRRRRQLTGAGVAVLAAAASVLLLLIRMTPDTLTFAVGAAGEPGELDHWVRAPGTADLPLVFSDGSRIVLQPGARGRVVRIDERGARLLLETGAARAEIVPRSGADWTVDAGPFTVRVEGTRFVVFWEPTAERLRVSVDQGRVAVLGPVIGEEKHLVAGQQLVVSVPEGRVVLGPEGAAAEASSALRTASSTGEADLEAPVPGPSAERSGGGTPAPRAPDWQALAAAKKPREAMAAVESEGFAHVTRQLSAQQLWRLADVARMAGQPARASSVLHTLRKRHPGTREAALAAYTLGTTAFDQQRSFTAAAGFFETYLREQAGGPLAREALGRLMECRQRLGQLEAARGHARHYLRAYPQGPHRDVAERLIDGR